MKLIVLAAGKGTRFYPLTKALPKGLVPLAGKPLIDHVLQPFLSSVSDIVLVINPQTGHLLKEHFGSSYRGHAVSYVIQDDERFPEMKGTWGAVSLCRELVAGESAFCVSNCDDLLLEADVSASISVGQPGLGLTRSFIPWNYLGIETRDGFVTGFRTHAEEDGKMVEDLSFSGFCVLGPQVFGFEPVIAVRNGERGLPQTLLANLDKCPLRAFEFTRWQAVNGPDDTRAAEDFLGNISV